MTPEEMKDRAEQMLGKRFHWSQAVLAAAQEKLGKKNEDLMRAMGPFGGGLAGNGEVCGAVVGALAVVGLISSRGNEEEKESPRMWTLGDDFLERFKTELSEGKIRCYDIAGIDWSDPNQVQAYYARGSEKQIRCRKLVGETARILGEMLENDLK